MKTKAYAGILVFIFIISCLLFNQKIYADSMYIGESISFDENDNLVMTTRDKAATSGVRYKTIGWIIKKSYGEGAGNKQAPISLQQSGPSVVDPYNKDYIYSYFRCDSATIKKALEAVDKTWADELYEKGGFVYLDAIMTVVENGKDTGEIYKTYEGIAGARNWVDKTALKSHYNKVLYFYPQKNESESINNKKTSYGEKENAKDSFLYVKAKDLFDVTTGIPTGEKEYAIGKLQKCLYYADYEKISGMVAVPVTVTVYWTVITETEDGPVSTTLSNTYTAYSNKSYVYYRIPNVKFYGLDCCKVRNDSFPTGEITLKNLYKPNTVIRQNRGEYIRIGRGSVTINADTFTGDLSALIDAAAPEPSVRNDEFIIDKEVVLDGSWYTKKAPKYADLSGSRLVEVKSDILDILNSKRNGIYDTEVVLSYKSYNSESIKSLPVANTNPVMVHTPTVCKAYISDDKLNNEQIVPTSFKSLVLGRDFSVGISTVGLHKSALGYGSKDYSKYTLTKQVRFPFEVYKGSVLLPANQWITLESDIESFFLPLGVREDNYKIVFRSIASNAKASGTDYKEQKNANISEDYHGAFEIIDVTVIGSLYGFEITDIVDYPRWRNVFYDDTGEKTGFTYTADKLPVLNGDNPFNKNTGLIRLGYRVKYQIKTTGNMTDDKDMVVLDTKFFYKALNDNTSIPVKLYSTKDLKEVHPSWCLTKDNRRYLAVNERNVANKDKREKSIQVWNGEFYISPDILVVDSIFDFEKMLKQNGGRVKKNDQIFLKDGYLIVNLDIKSVDEDKYHLSYINPNNNTNGYCNRLKVEGFKNTKRDAKGNEYDFGDGDLLVFDLKNTIYSDYDSVGTH